MPRSKTLLPIADTIPIITLKGKGGHSTDLRLPLGKSDNKGVKVSLII